TPATIATVNSTWSVPPTSSARPPRARSETLSSKPTVNSSSTTPISAKVCTRSWSAIRAKPPGPIRTPLTMKPIAAGSRRRRNSMTTGIDTPASMSNSPSTGIPWLMGSSPEWGAREAKRGGLWSPGELLVQVRHAPGAAVERGERELLVRRVHLVVVETEADQDARHAGVRLLEGAHDRDRSALADQGRRLAPGGLARAGRGFRRGMIGLGEERRRRVEIEHAHRDPGGRDPPHVRLEVAEDLDRILVGHEPHAHLGGGE